jgi:hypothetical protein
MELAHLHIGVQQKVCGAIKPLACLKSLLSRQTIGLGLRALQLIIAGMQ